MSVQYISGLNICNTDISKISKMLTSYSEDQTNIFGLNKDVYLSLSAISIRVCSLCWGPVTTSAEDLGLHLPLVSKH